MTSINRNFDKVPRYAPTSRNKVHKIGRSDGGPVNRKLGSFASRKTRA